LKIPSIARKLKYRARHSSQMIGLSLWCSETTLRAMLDTLSTWSLHAWYLQCENDPFASIRMIWFYRELVELFLVLIPLRNHKGTAIWLILLALFAEAEK
jgi:hypothetical protein